MLEDKHILFFHSSVNGHLSFHFLAIMSNAEKNSCVQACVWKPVCVLSKMWLKDSLVHGKHKYPSLLCSTNPGKTTAYKHSPYSDQSGFFKTENQISSLPSVVASIPLRMKPYLPAIARTVLPQLTSADMLPFISYYFPHSWLHQCWSCCSSNIRASAAFQVLS